MDTINRAGGIVIWIGLPHHARRRPDAPLRRGQRRRRQRRRAAPGQAAYVDTYTMFAGDDGGYAEYLPDAHGGPVKVRAGDGVHFERAGGDMIAREVLKTLNQPTT